MFGFWLLNLLQNLMWFFFLLKKENKQQRTYKKNKRFIPMNTQFVWNHYNRHQKDQQHKTAKKTKQKQKQMAYGCVNLQFTLTQLIIDTITCAITITASMPPTDIIAMCIHVTLLFCVGFVKIVFSICSFIAFSEKNFY